MAALNEPRRLAQLPGYDTSPDVYETPVSQGQGVEDPAITPSTSLSQDDSSSDSDSDASSASSSQLGGVSRRRLYPSQARKHFASTSVRARNVDLSDRVDAKRQGYRVRPRTGEEGEEEEEGLDARIARLKREVEECRHEAARRKDNPGATSHADSMTELGQVLARLELRPPPASSQPTPPTTTLQQPQPDHPQQTPSDPPLPSSQTLSKLSALDLRLAALESTLGLTSLSGPDPTLQPPLLPTLSLLDAQLAALSSASSLASLDALSSRVSALKADARALLSAPSLSSTQGGDAGFSRPSSSGNGREGDEDEADVEEEGEEVEGRDLRKGRGLSGEDRERMSALFALIPTLSALAPTVPALLARLKSLRALHTAAAGAGAELEGVARRQGELAAGMRSWREGLERVEEAVEEAGEANGKNGRVLREWIEGLEGRVKGLK